jgi:Ca2+-binding RTX toxin-like protein
MSFIAPPASDIFGTRPVDDEVGAVLPLVPVDPDTIDDFVGERTQVDGTSGPVEVGGEGAFWATTPAPAGETNEILLTGQSNTLILGAGATNVQVQGSGNIVEARQEIGVIDSPKVISLGDFGVGSDSNNPNVTVDLNKTTAGNEIGSTTSVLDAAGGGQLGTDFQNYAHGGTGNDTIYGGSGSDFIRGGSGDDQIYGWGGNDLIRGGSGSDFVSMGIDGNDTLYYTSDQLGGGDVDTISDFTFSDDRLAFDASAVGAVDSSDFSAFSGFGTSTLAVTVDGNTTQVVASNNYVWDQDDILFVV